MELAFPNAEFETIPALTVDQFQREPKAGLVYSVSTLDNYQPDDPMFYEQWEAETLAAAKSAIYNDVVVVEAWQHGHDPLRLTIYVDGEAFVRIG
ncbi:MAG: hypothetical protein AAF125_13755 [Chloroflexota bacterium]